MKIKLKKFNVKASFENGQCFRWKKIDEKMYDGVIAESFVKAKEEKDHVLVFSEADLDPTLIKYYFREEESQEIEKSLYSKDAFLDQALEYAAGMRIFRQDPWEMIISFIISQNNHIRRIQSLVEVLSTNFGKKIVTSEGIVYSFPRPEDLIENDEQLYRELGFGYRAKYLVSAADLFYNGELVISDLQKLSDPELLQALCRIKGVGEKVAYCIMLFGFDRLASFPVDTWIKKVLTREYPEILERPKDAQKLLKDHFGEYAGIAQQFLFYFAKEKGPNW